ncbi:ROK family protein [Paenibacillus sp. GCM10027628]|uniref:ROK family transcriptional regulator n=1 Tax=Paenibacillus sp. GCM10027628 TaxID=3273413 RepID=UPI0036426646
MEINKHDQEFIKKKNKNMVLDLIKSSRPISRAEIAKMTSMSPTSVGRIVSELCQMGLVKETDQYSSGVGRKATLLDIDAGSVLAIGVQMDKGLIKIGIVDFDGRIVVEKRITRLYHLDDPAQVAVELSEQIKALIDAEHIETAKIIGIGIGVPGIIDTDKGMIVFSSQLGWKNVSFASLVQSRLNMPTVIDNDLKVKALGENYYGFVKGSKRAVLLGFGSGVGSALVIDGTVYRGESNIAGEIGHSTIDPNGMLCECGKRGCLQTYIADFTLIQEANKVKPIASIQEIFDSMRNNETWALHIIDRACTYIAITVSNVVCMYNPETIILSGDLIEQHPEMLETVKQKINHFIWGPFNGTYHLVSSKLQDIGVIVGAATLTLQQYLDHEI